MLEKAAVNKKKERALTENKTQWNEEHDQVV